MAATVLGTHHHRRRRFPVTCGLHPLQPRQARMGQASSRLAVFIVSPLRATRHLATQLGGQRNRRKIWRIA
jgi:hypothetical protein